MLISIPFSDKKLQNPKQMKVLSIHVAQYGHLLVKPLDPFKC